MAAIRLARRLADEQRLADPDEQRVLAGWSSWGAIPDVFDEAKDTWATERDELRALMTPEQWRQAERTTINAHYTDPLIVSHMWRLVEQLGFAGGRVLEPGAGSGTFIGLAPPSAEMVGVELDEVTASIAAALYPHATVRVESFADTRLPGGFFDAAIGNVPFANVRLHDPTHNAGRHSMHNHFILKSLALTRPGGLVTVLTSHFTLDAQNPAARREIAQMADLLGAVRLPSGAHRRTAGTEAVTDLLVLRRRDDDQPPAPQSWETVTPVELDGTTIKVNAYFTERPDHVLGELAVGRGMHGRDTLLVNADLDRFEQNLERALADITSSARARGLSMTARPSRLDDSITTPRRRHPLQWSCGTGASSLATMARSEWWPLAGWSRCRCRKRRERSCGRCWGCGTRRRRF
ncbi:hypothetical protein H5398_07840 [Tessaracoccus sp. MC1679]|uniref:hypothetical protein n=1 Tax=Tessaracoccus sp. MC1679 TaxID=2760313 RepID=UPI001602B69C|nr:hypothetical protein [Tessaracoccus sp. MC1679]MBB1515878.1 hypothetical protein [Tessaracoccus sp. MC1679]